MMYYIWHAKLTLCCVYFVHQLLLKYNPHTRHSPMLLLIFGTIFLFNFASNNPCHHSNHPSKPIFSVIVSLFNLILYLCAMCVMLGGSMQCT